MYIQLTLHVLYKNDTISIIFIIKMEINLQEGIKNEKNN